MARSRNGVVRAGARKHWVCLAVLCFAFAVHGAELRSRCINITSPLSNYSLNTQMLQAALDLASTSGSDDQLGCVSISGGDFPVKKLDVGSNTWLRIEPGARLVNVINVTRTAVVHVLQARNVLLEGGGTIYGNAERAWNYWSTVDDRMSPYFDDGLPLRTNTLRIESSSDVIVRDLHLHNSTDWTFRLDNSTNVWVERVDIYGDSRFPNNDGFDPQSCRNITLIDSAISVADDGICPKAAASMGPLIGLYVRNVTVRSKSHAIKFGSNTDDDMRDIVFDNITIWDSNGGMSIQQRTEGDIENVTWSNIRIETRYQAPRWWGNGEWLGFTNAPRGDGHRIGSIRGMRFVNITARSENGGLVSGLSSAGASNISFENVHVKIAAWGNYSDGSGPQCFVSGRVCSNDTGTTPTPLSNSTKCTTPGIHGLMPGDEINCMGSRDYRPIPNLLPPDLPPRVRGGDRTPSKADALFLENVHGVSFANVTFEFESPRQPWFGACLVVDKYSDGIKGAGSIKCINGNGRHPITVEQSQANQIETKNRDTDGRNLESKRTEN